MAKILIVDDDIMITTLMQSLVSIDGHEAVVVNDSTEAIDTARTVKPDLITLDLMMPHLSGFELCDLLRADTHFANIPIIIISAKEDSASQEKALALGANRYLKKPFNIDEFLGTIRELVA